MLPKIQTILYATGIGPGAPYVFRHALALARVHDAKIVAVHGTEPLSPFARSLVELHVSPADVASHDAAVRQSACERLRERIARLCAIECDRAESCPSRVDTIRVVEAAPAQAVLRVAEEVDADLIVMGAHRHTVLGDALLGTTTSKVLHSTARPVLVVRIPDGYHEEGF